MVDVPPSIEVGTISGIVSNFGWKVVKQEITEAEITVTIKKKISPSGEITPSSPD